MGFIGQYGTMTLVLQQKSCHFPIYWSKSFPVSIFSAVSPNISDRELSWLVDVLNNCYGYLDFSGFTQKTSFCVYVVTGWTEGGGVDWCISGKLPERVDSRVLHSEANAQHTNVIYKEKRNKTSLQVSQYGISRSQIRSKTRLDSFNEQKSIFFSSRL